VPDVRAICVSTKNAEQVTGFPWRWLRDHFPNLVIQIDGKSCIPADRLLAALELRMSPIGDTTEIDDLARARLEIANAH
jgi:hypothetical protein